MAKCRVCGAVLGKQHGRCRLGKICCECADNGFGCFTSPLFRDKMGCLVVGSAEAIAKGDNYKLSYFGIKDIASFRKRWTVLATEKPYECLK